MTGLLPIYKKGTLKNFQLTGNYQNWQSDLILASDSQILPFVSPFFDTILTGLVKFSFYKIDETKLSSCRKWSDIWNIVTTEITMDTADINKQTVSGIPKQRYYCTSETITPLASGVYFLYFADATNEFESEIFKIL